MSGVPDSGTSGNVPAQPQRGNVYGGRPSGGAVYGSGSAGGTEYGSSAGAAQPEAGQYASAAVASVPQQQAPQQQAPQAFQSAPQPAAMPAPAPSPQTYGQPYGQAAQAPVEASERPGGVPAQRSATVYGQPRPTPPMTSWQQDLIDDGSTPPPPVPAAQAFPGPAAPKADAAPRTDYEPIPAPGRGRKRFTYIAVTLLVIIAGIGALYYTSRTDPPKVGDCVTQSGASSRIVACGTKGSYQVISQVSDVSKCPDPKQPSLVGDKGVVFCLRPQQ